MSHTSELSANLYRFLLQIDLDTLALEQDRPCPHCGGKLDRADFMRKPRGSILGPEDDLRRFSLCCREDGCRKRLTPKSVRFMGRKVFLGFYILLVSSLPKKKENSQIDELGKKLLVSHQTLKRWVMYWRKDFSKSVFWLREQGLFNPPFEGDNFATILMSRFQVQEFEKDGWGKLLNFLAPCFS